MSAGSYFRGRPLRYDPDAQAIEQERQRWVYEKIDSESVLITELAVDPDEAYRDHMEAYVQTGDETHLRWALEYVRP